MLVGVISDTHGLLRPEAIAALRGAEHILHAGDIGSPEIIPALKTIAPVTAIRGNVDREPWTQKFPDTEVAQVAGLHIYMIHDLNALDLDPKASGFAAVINGHTHQSRQETKNGVLYFNPGSAGPKRFNLPVSIGFLEIADGKLSARTLVL
ncbi:MAG TPA: metallophosphoesterase family protein [Verrucomicrobiae bacterium]|jgi:putative phosphoesterase|nr:metallophosphoesterase family protein [Verrucomicrobiae bacterium]